MSTDPQRPCRGPAYSPTVRDLQRSGSLRRALAGLLLGTALLTGCSEKTEGNETLPPASAAPTTEALPPVGPADFPVPDEARTKDAAGAEAFLRYWIDLLNRQQSIPAGQPLRDLGPECQECLRIARNYDDVAAAGHRYEGGELTLNDVPPPVLDGAGALINFGVRRESVRVLDGSGAVVDAGLPMAPNVISGTNLIWSEVDQSWLVENFNIG